MTRILIVEDDRLVLATLADNLEDRGYHVSQAASGEAALALTEAAAPDLVIMDICLPGITGIETARRIREVTDVPVIFLSALDADEVVRAAIGLGSLGYLVKPVGIQQLVPAIENALARARDLRQLRAVEDQLVSALKQDRDVSVAIGILMERMNLSAEDAFELLRMSARSARRKAIEVARDVIAGSPGRRSPGPGKGGET